MTYHKPGDAYDHTDEGIAIFSKFPILETSFLRLSRDFSDSQDEHQRVSKEYANNIDNTADFVTSLNQYNCWIFELFFNTFIP